MNAEPTIQCPSCRAEIKLTESLAAPLIAATRRDFEQKLHKQTAEFAKREQTVKEKEDQLAKEKESLDATLAERLKAERDKLTAEAAKQTKALKDQQDALAKEKEAVDATVAEKLKTERDKLAADAAKQAKALKEQQESLARQKEELETTLADKLKQERTKIAADEARKAKLALGDELEQKTKDLADLNAVLKSREEKLAEAQKAQAQLLVKQRELDDAKREMDLTIETRVTDSLAKVRDTAKKEVELELSLKITEKDLTIKSMLDEIRSLKEKAEQGSQERQGEALEWQLEQLLRGKFLHDGIEPVPRGEHGGDILHRVNTPAGVSCGSILWESKRTKKWMDNWLPKLRDDQRAAKADLAVIVSMALPDHIDTFDQIDGVWIVHPRCVLPVALSLRCMLIDVTTARQAGEGQQTKMEMVYAYLTGPKFRLRVEALAEAFTSMNEDLFKEKKATQRQWAKREEQITRMMEATVGMYGELQGIAGKSLVGIEGLELSEDEANSRLALGAKDEH